MLAAISLLFLARLAVHLLHLRIPWLWGFCIPAYAGDALDTVLLLLPLPLLAWLWIARDERSIPADLPPRLAAGLAGALAALVILSMVMRRVHYPFLGDGVIMLSEMLRVLERSVDAGFFLKPSTFGTGQALVTLARLLDPQDMRLPFQALGLLGAGVAAIGLALLARRFRIAWPSLLAVLTTAPLLLFHGYVELYALQYGATVLACACLLRALREQRGAAACAVALALAMYAGLAAALYLPLLALLWRRDSAPFIPARLLVLAQLGVAAGAVAVNTVLPGGPLAAYVAPLLPQEIVSNGVREGVNAYAILSPSRLLDALNLLYLNGGVYAVLLALLLADARNDAVRPAAAVYLTGMLCFVLCTNSLYGFAQDWDIYTVIVPGLALLLALAAERPAAASRRFSLLLLAAALYAAGDAGVWIGVNCAPAGADRYGDILRASTSLPPWNRYRQFANLESYRRGRGDADGQVEALFEMLSTRVRGVATLGDLDATIPLARAERRTEYYRRFFRAAIEMQRDAQPATDFRHVDPAGFRQAVTAAMLSAERSGAGAAVEEALPELGRSIVPWPEVGYYYAAANAALTPAQRAGIVLAIREPVGHPLLLSYAGSMLAAAGLDAEAAARYEASLEAAPCAYPNLYAVLARLCLERLGDRQRAARVIERALSSCEYLNNRGELERLLAQCRDR